MREKEEPKNETAKKAAAQKVCLQQKKSESFSMFIELVNTSSNILKDAFSNLGGNIGELPNQIRENIIQRDHLDLKVRTIVLTTTNIISPPSSL